MVVKKNKARSTSTQDGVPKLPESFRTRSGVDFDPRADHWNYLDGIDRVKIDFGYYRKYISADLLVVFKSVLMHSSSELAAGSLLDFAYAFKVFCEATFKNEVIFSITRDHVKHFWIYAASETYKKTLRQVFLRWLRRGYTGLERAASEYIKSERLVYKRAGEAVLTWCPISGPLTHLEFSSTYNAILDAYGVGKLSKQKFLVLWLSACLGLRPRQIALLKAIDCSKIVEGGLVRYVLDIPRIKQKAQLLRDEMYRLNIIEEVGALLYSQALASEQHFSGTLDDPLQGPLFFSAALTAGSTAPESDEVEVASGLISDEREPTEKELGKGYEYHFKPATIATWSQSLYLKLELKSERVGENFRINASRMRRSYGTRLAAEGYAPSVIAQLMTHRDIKSSKIYIAATSGLQTRLDRSMAFELAPLAQAFKGELLMDWDDKADTQVVKDLRIAKSNDPLGKCGKHGFCGFAAPIACYTCKKFKPWVDGPHLAVFDYLWKKREKREGLNIKNDSNMVMLHDQTIVAVAQVIMLCEIARKNNDE
jgi:hypothetical protein